MLIIYCNSIVWKLPLILKKDSLQLVLSLLPSMNNNWFEKTFIHQYKIKLMKKAVVLLGLFFASFGFAQQKEAKSAVENFVPDVSALPDYQIIKNKLDLKQVVTKADTIPEFPGGMIAFKKKYFENIETLDLKNNEKVDIRLYFIVEKNGYVRNATAVSKNKKHAEEAELGVRRIFVRWKPAKLNGQPVRYLFYFPLTSKKYN